MLIKVIASKLGAMGMNVRVSATTGMAATLIGGTTLHRWAGVGLAKEPAKDLLKRMRRETRQRWRDTDCLIIDEVSMLDPELFVKLDEIGRHLRSSPALFGGIQIIASGDFLQLPPVNPAGLHRFVFQTEAWESGIEHTFAFAHIYRTTDALFTEVLGRVRTADTTAEDVEILKTRLNATIAGAEESGILPTRMYSHRGNVDAYNAEQLALLPGRDRTSEARLVVARGSGAAYAAQRQYVLRYTRAEGQAKQSCPVGATMKYRDGAQVMLVVNLDPDAELVNGSRGVVTDAHCAAGIKVRFFCGEERIIDPFVWKTDDARGDRGEDISLTLTQIPLVLAWAYTVRLLLPPPPPLPPPHFPRR